MADEEDLVSQIKVTGGAAATAEIETFAQKSGAALDDLNKKAAGSGAGFQKAASDIGRGAQQAQQGLSQLKPPDLSKFQGGLANLEAGMRGLTGSIKPAVQAIGRFASRVALVGTATAAAATGFVEAARRIAVGQNSTTSAFEKNTKAQQTQNDRMAEGQIAQIQLASSQEGLRKQLVKGEITYAQYGQAIRDSNEAAAEQAKVDFQVEQAQDRAKEANERLQKSLENRQALEKLINTFGGPLTTALTAFGNQAEATRQKFVQGFGPAIAQGIDLIGTVLSKNSGAIQKFIDDASNQISTIITQNGPAITQALETLGAGFRAVFQGLLDAAPSIINFFNEGIVPAVKAVSGALSSLAEGINSVFGTKITGGTIAFIILLGQLTGTFRILFTVVRVGAAAFQLLFGAARIFFLATGPWGILLTLLAAALVFLATQVDWPKFFEAAKKVIDQVIAYFAALPGRISGFFSQLWTDIKAKASSAAQGVTDVWNTVVTFFTDLVTRVGNGFVFAWEQIKQGATDAAQWVQDKWNALIAFFTGLGQSILSGINSAWESVKQAATDAVQWVIDKWNGFVSFIQTLPATLGQVWTDVTTALTDAFNTAVETVKTYFSNLAASARAFLQPILDLINAILGSGTLAGGGGGNTVNAASGGHIKGAGTETSDSILARLSNNEFVMKARAVRQYGVNFMHQVNSGRFRLPKFNMGGLVNMSPIIRPAFADGGSVQTAGMTPLNLSLFGEQFNGLMMPEDVAGRMTKFAIARSTRSAGRKPSWVGGKR